MKEIKTFGEFTLNILPELKEMGYTYFEPLKRSPAIFLYKALANGNVLGLGLFASGINKFVANFFISKTTFWIPRAAQIPENSVCGFFQLMIESEKTFFQSAFDLDLQQWKYDTKQDIKLFLIAVHRLETRFLEQPDLIEQVNKSVFLNEMKNFVTHTQIRFEKITSRIFGILKPSKNVLSTFSKYWILAAAQTLKEDGGIQNEEVIHELAYDAYVQYQLFNKS